MKGVGRRGAADAKTDPARAVGGKGVRATSAAPAAPAAPAASAAPLPLSTVLREEFELFELGPKEQGKEKNHGTSDKKSQSGEERPESQSGGSEEDLIKGHFERVHASQGMNALCLSGGGVRSASFSLGVIQGLAKCDMLKEFHYLSTVSGGGYVGGWLSAWIHRHPRGFKGVREQLKKNRPRDANTGMSEPETVVHLREYSNYLSPRVGLMSLDTWTLGAIYLRNLLLTWSVLVPLLVTVLLVPRLLSSLLWLQVGETTLKWLKVVGILLTLASMMVAVLSLPSLDRRVCGPESYEPSRRPDSGEVWAWVILPMILASLAWSLKSGWAGRSAAQVGELFDYLDKAGRITPFFAAAGVATYVIARWILRKPNPPRFTSVCVGFTVLSLILALLLLYVRSWWWSLNNKQNPSHEMIICAGIPIQLAIFLAMITGYVGWTSRDTGPGGDDDREWWGRVMGALALVIVGWLMVTGISLFGPIVVSWIRNLPYNLSKVVAALSLVGGVVGLLGGHSTKSGEAPDKVLSTVEKVVKACPPVGAYVFLGALLLLLSTGVNAVLPSAINATAAHLYSRPVVDARSVARHPQAVRKPAARQPQGGVADEADRAVVKERHDLPLWLAKWLPGYNAKAPAHQDVPRPYDGRRVEAFVSLWTVAAVVLAIALVLGRIMNVNRLSLHAIYRARLIRAFLGASNPERVADPFTGFDPADNLPIHHLRRLQYFTEEDLIGEEEDKKEEDPRRYVRVQSLVKDWKERSSKLSVYVHDKLSAHPNGRKLLASNVTDGLTQWKKDVEGATSERGTSITYLGIVLEQLNRLLADRRLLEHSRIDDVAPGDSRYAEIVAAAGQFQVDGRPNLLNRLILEDAWRDKDDVSLLRPAREMLGPLHVVNLSLNLVSGKNLAWQQRKAASFVVSPLHSGFCLHAEMDPEDCRRKRRGGYRPSVEYGRGITLGTAMAISGAAASPNMGYHSSPAVTLLMTLFNVRLGWWLGNPAERPLSTWWRRFRRWASMFPDGIDRNRDLGIWRVDSPRQPLSPIVNEAIGRTSADNDYVYLSDGGHFENLGLYEMVRRRCRFIVVADASCDPECAYDDLGNSVRKIRTDLGISICLDNVRFRYGKQCLAEGKFCAIGIIDYKAVDGEKAEDGVLLYVKAALRENLPVDVFNYHRRSGEFPHEPTTDQWFGESQFESYRHLGEECIDVISSLAGGIQSWTKKAAENIHMNDCVDRFLDEAREHLRRNGHRRGK